MQPLNTAVGTGQTNASADVAIVQAMLVLIRKPLAKAGPYLSTYDGSWGEASNAALRAFQADKVFAKAGGKAVPGPNCTAGAVKPGDATWLKLVANTPAAFADLRALPGGRTVYVAATAEQLGAKLAAVSAATFAPAFRPKVSACINEICSLYGIACGVCKDGDRRDFQTQYALRTSGRKVTNAGPGESNHNFGMAVDMGFSGLRWLRKDGTVVTNEGSWLNQLNPDPKHVSREAMVFWNALRAVGTSKTVGLFRGPEGDRPHLQSWSDIGVNMSTRLADLLTRSGSMKWSGTHGRYSCDLGLGGALIPVGTAVEIWNNRATITIATLAKARAAAGAAGSPHLPKPPVPFSDEIAGAPAQTPHLGSIPKKPAPPTTEADVAAVKRQLREQFELADANWTAWKPH